MKERLKEHSVIIQHVFFTVPLATSYSITYLELDLFYKIPIIIKKTNYARAVVFRTEIVFTAHTRHQDNQSSIQT